MISVAVIQLARDEEEAQSFAAQGRAFRAGKEQNDFCISAGAKPFVSLDAPLPPIRLGDDFDIPDVGTGALLGEKLCATIELFNVVRQHSG